MCGDVALVFEAREGEWGCGTRVEAREGDPGRQMAPSILHSEQGAVGMVDKTTN